MRRGIVVIALVTLLGGAVVGCGKGDEPDKALAAFAQAWQQGTASQLRYVAASGAAINGDQVAGQLTALSGDLANTKPKVAQVGKVKTNKDDATGQLRVDWPLAANVTWSYQTTVPLHHDSNGWQVVWGASVVNPGLHDGERLKVTRTAAARGQVLDGSGQPIITDRAVVDVGVVPKNVTDVNALVKALGDAFTSVGVQVDLSGLPAQVKSAPPDQFLDVVTLRRDAYDRIRDRIHDLPGTQFNEGTLPLAPSRVFARALLGHVDQVDKQHMDAHPGTYQLGDLIGYGGLEEKYEDQLRGAPGVTVQAETPKDANGNKANADRDLYKVDPKAGQALKTTIDQNAQNAADAALAGQTKRTALVAIRISDGAIVAVANGPDGGDQNLAFTAQTPPGSTFKVVTATNLLDAGKVTPNTMVNCPQSLPVGGRTFTNYGGEVLGNVPLHVDFAKSCNTAFASLAPQLGPDGLSKTAAQLGIGVAWNLGVDAYTGKVSANGDEVEQAAAAFGQGTTLVSPLVLAGAAAAIARGQWKQPTVLLGPAQKPVADQAPLKQSTLDALRPMMREVVTDGTATAVKTVPGQPVYGKTGTAEFDNNPNDAHSWFMGYRGDIAFACFVENGGLSSTGAVPLVGKFLTSLG